MRAAMLSYMPADSPIHNLTGAAKLIFFVVWSVTAMVTYDTRSLLAMFIFSVIAFKVSKVKFRDVSVVLYLILVFLLLNHLAIFLFSPFEGVKIYGTRHDLFHIAGSYTVTAEQLFYQLNITLKYFTVIPMALLFILTTHPSEFAASLNRIGVSYRIAFAVSIAMRYIPDIQRDFHNISFASQARGIDMSKNVSLPARVKNVFAILVPLILSSLERIETISAAMELRGFGHTKKRTWFSYRPFSWNDYAAVILVFTIMLVSTLVTFYDGNRFFNIFQE